MGPLAATLVAGGHTVALSRKISIDVSSSCRILVGSAPSPVRRTVALGREKNAAYARAASGSGIHVALLQGLGVFFLGDGVVFLEASRAELPAPAHSPGTARRRASMIVNTRKLGAQLALAFAEGH